MATRDVERKLTAVFVTDVAGYSRLMGDDHDATVHTLDTYRQVFSDYIQQHKGRVVNAPGDSILAEFGSVMDAVGCAVEVQRELAERNADLPEARRMRFRIGVNLGDVLVKNGELFGDGVNIAARLEALADPGGICISRNVHDQVKSRLNLEYEYLGEHEVKNIAEPVRAYRVLTTPGAAAHRVVGAKRALEGRWRRTALMLAAGLVLVVGLVAAGYFLQPWDAPEQADTASISAKPVIAVLAFDNLSGDKEQEYFSDGISESIITRLARLEEVVVIARNSSFKYKGKAVGIQQVGQELGATYVLEGSVQKVAGKVRIHAQLIETATDKHVWAEQYDRELKDVFAVQDEITRRVVDKLGAKLIWGEGARSGIEATANVEAYDLYLRARSLKFLQEKASNSRAIQLLERAIELDPEYSRAMAMLGDALWRRARWYEPVRPADDLKRAEALAERALAIDKSDPDALRFSASLHSTIKKDYETAIALSRRALEVEPNNYRAQHALAWQLDLDGQYEKALPLITRAIRIWPHPPPVRRMMEGWVNIHAGRYETAERIFRTFVQSPMKVTRINRMAHLGLILSIMFQGREAEARRETEKYKEIPEHPFKEHAAGFRKLGFKDPQRLKREFSMWRKAGFEE